MRPAQRPTQRPAAPPPVPSASVRLARAWAHHPVIALARHKKRIVFYRQFHSLLRAGVALPVAFAELSKYAPDDAFAVALRTVSHEVQAGATLAEAMRGHTGLFDDVNVELIAFAEEAGKLDPVLTALIAHLEEVQQLRWRVVMMSLWPLYLAGAFVFVGPLLTVAQSVKSAGDVGSSYLGGLVGNLAVVGSIVGLVFFAPLLLAAFALELPWDRFKRRAPLVAGVVRNLYASRLVMTLGLGLDAGLEVMRVLEVAVRATGSPSLLAALPGVTAHLRGGGTLTDALGTLGLLDRSALGALAVAERTGDYSTTLDRLAKELQASSVRAMVVLVVALVVLVAGTLLVKIVVAMLGTLFGPVKSYYDAVGSGDVDKLGGP
ncbi:MAG: type II secretion system F family protein [Deltaproteobacteria bacterium]|nr:type II secretion system F family protein [Deltaproteobacteria bacterium]